MGFICMFIGKIIKDSFFLKLFWLVIFIIRKWDIKIYIYILFKGFKILKLDVKLLVKLYK